MSNSELPLEQQAFLDRKDIHPFVFVFGVLAAIFVLYQVIGGTAAYIIAGANVTTQNVMAHRIITFIAQLIFLLVPTLMFTRLVARDIGTFFRWRLPRFAETFFAILGLLALQNLSQIYLAGQEQLPWPDAIRDFMQAMKEMYEAIFRILIHADSPFELAFVLAVIAFLPAFAEELLFRGLVQGTMEKVLKPLASAVVTGVIFAVFHLNVINLVPLIFLGIYFGYLRMKSQSVIIAMTAHFLNNALAVIGMYFGIEEPEMMPESIRGISGGMPLLSEAILYGAIFIMCMIAYSKVAGPRTGEPDED